jgi:hypothetical protein
MKVAEVLGVSQRQARQTVQDGRFPGSGSGNESWFPRAPLEGWEDEIDGQRLG